VAQPAPIQVASFFVGNERLALDLMRLREVVRPMPVTAVPKAPLGMVGVVDLRGEILPMFDLRLRFGLPERGAASSDHVRHLMVRLDGRSLGLVVDCMCDIATISRDQIRTGNSLFGSIGGHSRANEFFVGVVQLPKGLALLLNLRRLLGADLNAADIPVFAPGAT
jgi:purine-binding chemotaxis protein CheW